MQKKMFLLFFHIKWYFFFYSSLVTRHSSLTHSLKSRKKNFLFFSHKMILILPLVTRYSLFLLLVNGHLSLVTHLICPKAENNFFLLFFANYDTFPFTCHTSLVTRHLLYPPKSRKKISLLIFCTKWHFFFYSSLVTLHSSLTLSAKMKKKFSFIFCKMWYFSFNSSLVTRHSLY